jgi:uncharacterized protein YaeQ
MALKATIFKATLQIADMDRHYYDSHALTIARHPSETDDRMMVRIIAFALNAQERLAFAQNLDDPDQPALYVNDLTGATELWIDVGLPDERRIRKALGRAGEVRVYAYGGSGAAAWWANTERHVRHERKLSVFEFPEETVKLLAANAQRSMQLQVNIEGGEIWLANDEGSWAVELRTLKPR